MGSSKAKTLHVAEVSIEQFFRTHSDVYFVTFTEPGRKEGEEYWTKDQAEACLKPFRDLCSRRKISLLVVWERQKRGAWHPHCLTNKYLDVNWLRPWMMDRGWGPQMRLEWLTRHTKETYESGRKTVEHYMPGAQKVIRYLTKYLTKSSKETSDAQHKKVFGGSADSKCGSTQFAWAPWVCAAPFLYAWGRSLFVQLYGRCPEFADMRHVIRLGVEDSGWADVDFLWEFARWAG